MSNPFKCLFSTFLDEFFFSTFLKDDYPLYLFPLSPVFFSVPFNASPPLTAEVQHLDFAGDSTPAMDPEGRQLPDGVSVALVRGLEHGY